ncbi:hypothetical protein [Streptomyces brevispora]|uniref:FHA domain-containing protein n=1 Tax=Streptomyces brevispora TaxID=887462 RepID=A0ABZ1G4E0_9ACTN|nr:hypothetical protein [Streptomyces brevispora]WSC14768.1 hypothetical protein OIE64_19295 [Streptomyces brevispora]
MDPAEQGDQPKQNAQGANERSGGEHAQIPQRHGQTLNQQQPKVPTSLPVNDPDVVFKPALLCCLFGGLFIEDAPLTFAPTSLRFRCLRVHRRSGRSEHNVAVNGTGLHDVTPDAPTQLIADGRLFAHKTEDTRFTHKITVEAADANAREHTW